MGCGNTKEKIVERITVKKFNKITIIEERFNLLKELKEITGEFIIRRAVPDWRMLDNILTINQNSQNQSQQLRTSDKSKSINDCAPGQKKSSKTNNDTPHSLKIKSTTPIKQVKSNQMINAAITIKPCFKSNEYEQMENDNNKQADYTTRAHNLEEGSHKPITIKEDNSSSNAKIINCIKKNILEGKQDQVDTAICCKPIIHHSRLAAIIGKPDESDYEFA